MDIMSYVVFNAASFLREKIAAQIAAFVGNYAFGYIILHHIITKQDVTSNADQAL